VTPTAEIASFAMRSVSGRIVEQTSWRNPGRVSSAVRVPPPAVGLRYGFKGAYTTDEPDVIWIFANWTSRGELRSVVRHEAAHLAFARTHTTEESAGHSGPSEDFALAFEADAREQHG